MPSFPLLGEPIALDLANTVVLDRGLEVDLLGTPSGVEAWLAQVGDRLPAVPDGERLLEFRGALRGLLAARTQCSTPDRRAVQVVNTAAEATRLEVVGTPAGPSVRWRAASATDLALGALARSMIDVLHGRDGLRLRLCANSECILHFALGDDRRTFCSTSGCANRTRQARHRARRRQTRST